MEFDRWKPWFDWHNVESDGLSGRMLKEFDCPITKMSLDLHVVQNSVFYENTVVYTIRFIHFSKVFKSGRRRDYRGLESGMGTSRPRYMLGLEGSRESLLSRSMPRISRAADRMARIYRNTQKHLG